MKTAITDYVVILQEILREFKIELPVMILFITLIIFVSIISSKRKKYNRSVRIHYLSVFLMSFVISNLLFVMTLFFSWLFIYFKW